MALDVVAGMTDRLLVEAGIADGMRVLDLGSGRGEVAFLIAARVGATGHVIGIDRDARPLETARQKAATLQRTNVEFQERNLADRVDDLGLFDAIVGRRVLMYQPDAIATIRHLAAALRPGGVMAFHEHDATLVPASLAPLPLHRRMHEWVWRTVEREGANLRMGFTLDHALTAAGLVVGGVRAEAVVQTPTQGQPMGALLAAILPRIVERGVATREEIEAEIDTIDARLTAERAAANATYLGDLMFAAWARLPA